MARLPTVGGDSGNWGTVLNEYLAAAHNADGTLKLDVQTIADLKSIDVATLTDKQQAMVAGYATPGDGGGGAFYYDAAASTADNGGTVIAPTAGSGRWLRVYSGTVNVRWFGAKGDDDGLGGGTDDAAAFSAAYAAAIAGGTDAFIPAGTYRLGSGLTRSNSSEHTRLPMVYGEGDSTILVFDFADGNPLFKVENTVASKFSRGGGFARFKVVPGAGLAADGQGAVIQISGWTYGQIRSVTIDGVKGDGIYAPDRSGTFANPDYYSVTHLLISSCAITNIDGIAVNSTMGVSFGGVLIEGCYFVLCDKGGIVTGGHFTKITGTSVATCGHNDGNYAAGIKVERQLGAHGNGVLIERCELHGNALANVLLDGSKQARVVGNRFIAAAWAPWAANVVFPATGVKLANTTGQNTECDISNNFFRHDNAYAFNAFDFNNNGNNVEISCMRNAFTLLANGAKYTGLTVNNSPRIVFDDATGVLVGEIRTPAPSDTSANLGSVAAAVNTTRKFLGKEVYNTTTSQFYKAAGATAASVWLNMNGGADITPV